MKTIWFIYCPVSGPRWIGEAGPRKGMQIPCVVWLNKSAHAHGHHVSVYAATARAHWREEARLAAAYIAKLTGGLAWDNQGQINLLVPNHARLALAAMWLVDPYLNHHYLFEELRTGIGWNDARALLSVADSIEHGVDFLFRLWGYKQEPQAEEEAIHFSAPWESKEVYGGAKVEKRHSCEHCSMED